MVRIAPLQPRKSRKYRSRAVGINLAVCLVVASARLRCKLYERRMDVSANGGTKMKRFKLLPIAASLLSSALAIAGTTTPGYAWSWGSGDQENYQFDPVHSAEILEYGAQIGANWSAEIRDAALASQGGKTDQAHADDTIDPANTGTGRAPQAED
jgi:hypothetical protein